MAKDILDQEIRLTNGSSRKVFSKESVNGTNYYNCKVCRVAGLPGDNILLIHVNGKKHKRNLSVNHIAEYFDLPFKTKEYVSIAEGKTSEKVIEKPFVAAKITDLPSTSAAADALELKSRQLYRNNKEKLVASINENYKKYRSIPESHPLYKKEWEVFWLRRHNELKKEGKIDLDSYDYRPEWIKHFVAKIDEFEKIELQKVDDKRSQERHVTPKRTIETSSSSSDNENCDDRGNAAKKRFKRDYDSISTNRYFIHQNGVKKPELKSRGITDNDEVSVITVCRSLLALESDLGILASKVLLLLSSAVTFERENPNSSDEIILSDSENVVLLQTVQQKLKGMAILNLLEPNKMLIVKKSIQNIAILVHRANGKPQKSEKFAELANEISQALVASGNGNCTSEQLDELTSEFSEHFSVEPKHVASRTSKVTKKSSPIESLSDYEIKILLDNFANLTETEQRQIMDFLKNLETNDPGKADIFKNFLRSGSSGIFQVEQDVGYSFDDCRMSLFY